MRSALLASYFADRESNPSRPSNSSETPSILQFAYSDPHAAEADRVR